MGTSGLVRRAAIAVVAVFGLMAAPLVGSGEAWASADVTPPTFIDASLDKNTFNLDDGPAVVTVTVKAADPSGVVAPFVSASSMMTGQSAGYGQMALVAGTAVDGTWQRTITIPVSAAIGTWSVTLHSLVDTLGNHSNAGTIGSIMLSRPGPSDTTAPTLLTATIDKTSFDLGVGPATFTVTLAASDASGVKAPSVAATSAMFGQSVGLGPMTLTAGTATNGTWQRTITIPATAPSGTWYVTLYPLEDIHGTSSHSYSTIGTLTLHAPIPADVAAPSFISGTVDKTTFNLGDGPAVVTVSVRAIDPSGVAAPTIGADSTATDQTAGFGPMTLVAGTTIDGTWQRTITIPDSAAPGTWDITLPPLRDTLGNASGFTTTISTITLAPKPVLAGSTPTVSGTPAVGVTLTAKTGTWPTGTSFAYTWLADGVAVSGATSKTYTPGAATVGKKLAVKVTASHTGFESTTKSSASTAVVAKGTLVAATPTISGTAKVGRPLTAASSAWTTGAAFTYQWFGNGTAITGATKATFSPAAAQLGQTLSVKVTGTLAGYTSQSRTSVLTSAVVKGTLTAATPTISGTAKVGRTLTAASSAWTTGAAFTYQWFGNGTAIAGATKATFSPAAAQLGQTLSVKVTGTLAGYTSQSRTSVSTSAVVKGTLTAATPIISGTPKVGVVLSVKSGTWTAGTTLTYQWFAGGVAVSGATKSTFTPTAAQFAQKMSVQVTGKLSGYTTLSRKSVETGVVAR
jgi:phosphotransferase system IIA component